MTAGNTWVKLLLCAAACGLVAPHAIASYIPIEEVEGDVVEVWRYADATRFTVKGTVVMQTYTNEDDRVTFAYEGPKSDRITPGDRVRVRQCGMSWYGWTAKDLEFMTDGTTGKVETIATTWTEAWYAKERERLHDSFLRGYKIGLGVLYLVCLAIGYLVVRILAHVFPARDHRGGLSRPLRRGYIAYALIALLVVVYFGWSLYLPAMDKYINLERGLSL